MKLPFALPAARTLGALLLAGCAALGSAWAAGGSGSGGGGGGGGGGGSGSGDPDLPGEVLVKLRSSAALPGVLQRYSLVLAGRFGARPIYRLKIANGARIKDVVSAMTLDADVLIAESNPTQRSPEARKNHSWAIGTPQAYAQQWAPQSLHLPEAQRISTGRGVRVAVLDTGVDTRHPLLAGRMLPGFDFVDLDNDPSEAGTPLDAGWGHGTHVAGLVAMAAPDAKIMPVRVLDAAGNGNAWVLAEALLYAIDPDGNPATDDGAQVINMSLGSLSRTRIFDTVAQIAACSPAVPDDPIGDRSDPGYRDDEARCSVTGGAVVIAAAGNDGSGSLREYPAAESAYGMVSVAASDATNRVAAFSNSGNWIDLAAPGDLITSTAPGGGYATWSGTSMAAPLAAGIAALVRSAFPSLPPKDVARRLKRTAWTLCGAQMVEVDAFAALVDAPSTPGSCR